MTAAPQHPLPKGDLTNVVLIGGDTEALSWVPRLFRNPHFNLLGLLPVHPADLIHHLDNHGYRLKEPLPVAIFNEAEELAALPSLDLIIDTTLDPSTTRKLAEAGLGMIPRVNAPAMELLCTQVTEALPEPVPEKRVADIPEPSQSTLAQPTPAQAEPSHADPQVDRPREDPITADLMDDTDRFSARLAKEVGRAYRHGRTLGLIVIQLHDQAELPDAPPTDSIFRELEESLRLEDVVTCANSTFSILLPETGNATRHVMGRLTSNLTALKIPPMVAASPSVIQAVGWACFPQDAKTAQALVERAMSRMETSSPSIN